MAELISTSPVSEEGRRGEDATLGNTPGSQVGKFLIGFFASICAVFLPKIIVFLRGDGTDTIKIISTEYVVAGVVFAAVIGVVMLVFEWSKRSKPADIFMTALGIPAVISGAVNTVGTSDALKAQVALQRQMTTEVTRAADVKVHEAITWPTGPTGPISRTFELVPSALAASTGDARPVVGSGFVQVQLGVQAVQREFLVVLAQTPNRAEADAKARAMKPQFPEVAVVPAGKQFYVTTTSKPLREADALAAAVKLRNAGVAVSLVPVRG